MPKCFVLSPSSLFSSLFYVFFSVCFSSSFLPLSPSPSFSFTLLIRLYICLFLLLSPSISLSFSLQNHIYPPPELFLFLHQIYWRVSGLPRKQLASGQMNGALSYFPFPCAPSPPYPTLSFPSPPLPLLAHPLPLSPPGPPLSLPGRAGAEDSHVIQCVAARQNEATHGRYAQVTSLSLFLSLSVLSSLLAVLSSVFRYSCSL